MVLQAAKAKEQSATPNAVMAGQDCVLHRQSTARLPNIAAMRARALLQRCEHCYA
jgi:hypothetical protein